MALILPEEARETPGVWAGSSRWSPATARSAGSASSTCASRWPMAAARPACACASSPIPATVDPRFLVDAAKLDRIAATIAARWPGQIAPGDLLDPALWDRIEAARRALYDALDLTELD